MSMSMEFAVQEKRYADIRADLSKEYECLGEGRNRIVYDLGNGWVAKVPKSYLGMCDNDHEWCLASHEREDLPLNKYRAEYARTKWRSPEQIVLLMEKVTPPVNVEYDKLPFWVGCIDCGQVGYTVDGKLVAYDFGIC